MNETTGITRSDAKLHVLNGWHALIDEIYDKKPDWVEISDVKEKWGRLRIYSTGDEAWLDYLIEIEERSATICERCGSPAKSRVLRGWIYTLCDRHWADLMRENGIRAD